MNRIFVGTIEADNPIEEQRYQTYEDTQNVQRLMNYRSNKVDHYLTEIAGVEDIKERSKLIDKAQFWLNLFNDTFIPKYKRLTGASI